MDFFLEVQELNLISKMLRVNLKAQNEQNRPRQLASTFFLVIYFQHFDGYIFGYIQF